jgi:hypothetical protein
LKPANRRWVARRRLGEPTQTGPWPRASSPGRWQEAGPGRMGRGPKERVSPPDEFFSRRRSPKRPPDGDCARNGDFGMKSGSQTFTGGGGSSSEVFWRRKTEDCVRDFWIFWAGRGAKSGEEGQVSRQHACRDIVGGNQHR